MNHRLAFVVALTGALFVSSSCSSETAAAAAAHSVDFAVLPFGLEDHAMVKPEGYTEAKAALGKKLFFDTRLSSNDKISCETCHQHDKGWTDGIQFSTKVSGKKNGRNSPTLYNTGYHEKLYWDGRAPSLEKNIAAAWKGHMGGSEEEVKQIQAIAGYSEEFQAAFGGPATIENVPQALAFFVRTLRAGGSAFDRKTMSDDAKAGYALFIGKAGCAVCHLEPLFTDMDFHNTGAGDKPDPGRGKHDKTKPGAFKTPTLRNISRTAPYFHDGSVATLEAAVKFMVAGGKASEHRDPLLAKKDLTDEETNQLIAFLKALDSDESFEKPTLPK